MLLALSFPTEAQQTGKVYRIGTLSGGPVNKAFGQGLRELGYVEGQNTSGNRLWRIFKALMLVSHPLPKPMRAG